MATGPTVFTHSSPSGNANLDQVQTETLGQSARGTSGNAQYLVAANGAQTPLIPASNALRNVMITVVVDSVFANGTGAQPTFSIGETGSAAKFAATGKFTGAAAGTTFQFAGVLSANADLIVTAVAGTGTSTGGISCTAIAIPQ